MDQQEPVDTATSESGRLEPEDVERLGHGAVVVGIDGSDLSEHVVLYGLRDARRRQVPLLVLAGFRNPMRWAYPGTVPPSVADVEHDVLTRARSTVDRALATFGPDGAGEPIHVIAQMGPPADVLVAASRQAEVLVVGHRGRSDLTTRVIGSVGLSCVVHAHCTVTVVRRESVDVDAHHPVG